MSSNVIQVNQPSQTGVGSARLARDEHMMERVVFVDGLFGCGKTLMSAVVGSLDRVELMRYNHHLEYTCVLRHLNKIDAEAARCLLRIYTDLDLYNSMMSRETNFRFSDLSSAWMNRVSWRHLRRLFSPGDEEVISRIRSERPILHLCTHVLLGISEPLFETLGDRMRLIEVVRHPLYMVKQWYKWMQRVGADPRTFDIWFDHEGHRMPWYTHGWEDLFLKSNHMDRVVYGIERHWRLGMERLANLTEAQRSRVVVIPFEQFVLDPHPYMKRLESFMDTKVIGTTRRMMRRQRIPRKMIAKGMNLNIYRHYGWEPPEAGNNEKMELEKRRRFVRDQASSQAMAVLDRLSQEYEEKYFNPGHQT